MAVMSERARKLLHDAMDLPVSERAELAADLLASLDGEPDADVEAAWASEIERRAREALANPDDDLSWESVRAELHAASRVR
jgi:putative addiction module component (TIGR02574 family)